jgi:hypothetical protein
VKDLLDKLSSYNIFNYLLPGVLFATFVDGLTNLQVLQKDLIVGVFLYYFLGSVVSRIGSLVVEPILRRTKFLSFAPYDAFVKAAKVDPKIELLSEVNNMYRTFVALFLSVAMVALYSKASNYLQFLHAAAPWVCIVGLLGLFLLSYKKQTEYVVKRVEANKP